MRSLMSSSSQASPAVALVPIAVGGDSQPLSLDALIGAWLHEKLQRSQSGRTVAEYATTLADLRRELTHVDMDLDTTETQTLALLLQAWAARPRSRDGAPVAAATQNRRLAIVSSFYTYAKKHGLDRSNATESVARTSVQAYAAAQPLDFAEVTSRLAAIDRTTLAGKRDYALLVLALTTGRRLSELAALELRDIAAVKGTATVTWRRTKGGKVMHDQLDPDVSAALRAWIDAYYRNPLWQSEAPVWVSLARNGTKGHRLSLVALSDITGKRLGITKMHATRHTFAVAMEQSGAKLTDIQNRLGHSNAATTGIYMQRLHASENAYAGAVSALFGIK